MPKALIPPAAADPRPVSALTIAGSDSGGGAGIQADLKTFAAHRVHGLSAIAALTAQHTRGVTAVHVPPVDFLRAQLDACGNDFSIGVAKLGMLANRDVIDTVATWLDEARLQWVVIDPVMIATSGARLLEDDALEQVRDRLLPLASVLTPNLPEAEWLLGHGIPDRAAMRTAVSELLALGARRVLLKGGHLEDGADTVVDLFGDGGALVEIPHPRLPFAAHGTGCTLASAVAAQLALGESPAQACRLAAAYVHRALLGGYAPGYGNVRVLDHFGASPSNAGTVQAALP